ncbi:hypothetical protein FOA43_001885 [Brettanomyces nanus]|uniref:mRNA export factor GLE1 n=1 Tax=Eeniella nana TaxID=13502 RepID=A0A875S5U0_EENNA|nr:uncharacterized protein FOA43_001885 [Brettanomyces nanus]QPG74554.1 hypothetical protein FOA43_001885 [Brettanomyces nanus]
MQEIDPNYDSLSEDDLIDTKEDGSSASSTKSGSEEIVNVDNLSQYLGKLGLENRFQMASKMTKVTKKINVDDYTGNENDEQAVIVSKPRRKIQIELPGMSYELGFNRIKNRMKDRMIRKAQRIDNLIKEEKERRKLDEERRKQEEEKRRQEEARRRQEEERRRQEEARKRQEEEEEKERRRKHEELEKSEEEKKKQEVERMRKQESKKVEEQEQQQRLENEERLRRQKEEEMKRKIEESRKKKTYTDSGSITEEFMKYRKDIEDIKQQVVEPVEKNAELKKHINMQRRRINPKFGQLTSSLSQLDRITTQLQQLISQTKANEAAFKWILNFVAKAIIHQAEAEVGVKPHTSLALGSLALDLLLMFPELKYYLMARFVKKCPLVIGYTCNIDTEEGRVRMGWRKSDGSRWEDEARYNERLEGICTLYSVMTRLELGPRYKGYNSQTTKHPLPIAKSWIMLSRIANIQMGLITNVHFVLVGSWWDACAAQFLRAYGKQAKKLLQLLWNDWTSVFSDRKFSGAARLRLLGEELSSGTIDEFPPMDS